MFAIRFDNSFFKSVRRFTKNNPGRARAVKKSLRLFQQNPKHPSLHTEKLSGDNIWTIRIDHGNRLFFIWSNEKDIAIFFFVGSHDSYKTVKK